MCIRDRPRVEEVISSKPISQESAFEWLSKYLEDEQNAFDTGEIHQSHWGDMYSIYESIGVNTKGHEDTMRRLRFMPKDHQDSDNDDDVAPPVIAAAAAPRSDVASASQPNEAHVEEGLGSESDERRKKKRKDQKKSKNKAPKKAKKTKKKKRDKKT